MENLDIKDYFYYTDMIDEVKDYAGLETIKDETQIERIQERHRYISRHGENGNVIFVTSDYKNELIDICNEIYRKATGKDELSFLYEIRGFIPQVEEAIKELQLRRRRVVLETKYPKVRITDETMQYIINHPEKFINRDVRICAGKIYTDDEFEKMIKENLDEPLIDEDELILKRK